jgi:hypothetical protein
MVPAAALAITRARPGVEGETRQRRTRGALNLPKPLDVGALHLRKGFYAYGHRLARWSHGLPKGLRLFGEGAHHLLVNVNPL